MATGEMIEKKIAMDSSGCEGMVVLDQHIKFLEGNYSVKPWLLAGSGRHEVITGLSMEGEGEGESQSNLAIQIFYNT